MSLRFYPSDRVMTTVSDLLPHESSMLPDVGGQLSADDDDAAGYQAMMSELPTIVSMSGLLDGDFDELNGKQPKIRFGEDH